MDVSGKSTTIYDLPPEVLVLIFSSYAKSEGNLKLYTILAKVSTSWRKAALAKCLWTEMSLTTDDFSHGHSWLQDEDILELISVLKTLNFECIFDKPKKLKLLIFSALEQILKNSRNLENFNVQYSYWLKIPDFLFNLPISCPKITGIQIECIKCTNNLFLNWIEKYNVNLTRLILRTVVFTNKGLKKLCQAMTTCCPNMTNFELSYISTSDRLSYDAIDLNSIRTGCPKMKDLCLMRVKIAENDDLTSCFHNLKRFCFEPYLNGSDVCQSMVRILRGSKELKELELTNVDLKAETFHQLPCKFLRKLKVWDAGNITSDLWEILCHWKHSLTELDVLCKDTPPQPLFRYMEQYGKDNLESLSLRISTPEMERIKRILRQCVKLNFFMLEDADTLTELIVLNTQEKIIKWLNP